jgi:hypothetical protein
MNVHAAYSVKLLILSTIVAGAGKLVLFNSVGCDAFDHDRDDYMAYCNSAAHGHYDHAAFLFDLEPGVRAHVDSAKLLVLGSSHIQVAASTQALMAFEREHPRVRPYLMGFGYVEQDRFSEAVIRELRPRPKVVVIDADPFFDDSASVPARLLLANPGTERANALAKRLWHFVSANVCTAGLPRTAVARFVCGSMPTLYRSRLDGHWIFSAVRSRKYEVPNTRPAANEAALATAYAANADAFLKLLPTQRSCVVITAVPSVATSQSLARAIALRIDATFISPRLEALWSSDGMHLDTESGERWTTEFLRELEPVLDRCL